MHLFFKILFLIGNPSKIYKGNKAFQRRNLICYFSAMEGHRKLKFGEVSVQARQKFLRGKRPKKVSDLNILVTKNYLVP